MNPTKEQLIAYFSGALPPDQKRRVEDWLIDGPDDQLVEECIRLAMEDTAPAYFGDTPVPEKTLQAYEHFRQLTGHHPSGTKQRRLPFLKYGMAAAAAVILLAIGLQLYRYLFPAPEKSNLAAMPQHKQYFAARAAITRIALVDGSIVRLFPGSSLTLSDSFNTGDRIVDLKGRGFFDVAHNTDLPFYVRSGSISTRVLGTAFDVDMDQRDNTRIVVKDGKVRVAGADSILSDLAPGQGISVDRASGRWTLQRVDANEYCGWTKGELGFRQLPLRDILPTLELWFNVSFQVKRPELLDKKLTFFVRRQNLHEAMEVLSAAGGFTWQQEHDTIFIK